MDGQRFDLLAKAWVTGPTRRAALRLLAGATLGGLLAGPWAPEEAAARCKGFKARCDKNHECCSRRCHRRRCECGKAGERCRLDDDCCLRRCEQGRCRCPDLVPLECAETGA